MEDETTRDFWTVRCNVDVTDQISDPNSVIFWYYDTEGEFSEHFVFAGPYYLRGVVDGEPLGVAELGQCGYHYLEVLVDGGCFNFEAFQMIAECDDNVHPTLPPTTYETYPWSDFCLHDVIACHLENLDTKEIISLENGYASYDASQDDRRFWTLRCDVDSDDMGPVTFVHYRVDPANGQTQHVETVAPYYLGGYTTDGEPHPVKALSECGSHDFDVIFEGGGCVAYEFFSIDIICQASHTPTPSPVCEPSALLFSLEHDVMQALNDKVADSLEGSKKGGKKRGKDKRVDDSSIGHPSPIGLEFHTLSDYDYEDQIDSDCLVLAIVSIEINTDILRVPIHTFGGAAVEIGYTHSSNNEVCFGGFHSRYFDVTNLSKLQVRMMEEQLGMKMNRYIENALGDEVCIEY